MFLTRILTAALLSLYPKGFASSAICLAGYTRFENHISPSLL